jgi:hypothetical protein
LASFKTTPLRPRATRAGATVILFTCITTYSSILIQNKIFNLIQDGYPIKDLFKVNTEDDRITEHARLPFSIMTMDIFVEMLIQKREAVSPEVFLVLFKSCYFILFNYRWEDLITDFKEKK